MRLLSLLVLALPLAAMANDFTETLSETVKDNKPKGSLNVEKMFSYPGAVTIDGLVEVDLIDGDPNDPVPYVEVRLLNEESEERFLFAVDPTLTIVAVTEGFATKAGAKKVKSKEIKHAGGVTADVATIDGFRIGDASFGQMTVFAGFSRSSDVPISGVIGLSAFPQLAAALLPSEGKLALYPAGQGGEALARVRGGAQLPYTSSEYAEHSMGKHVEWIIEPERVLLPGKVGDREVTVRMTTFGIDAYTPEWQGMITRDNVEGLTPTKVAGAGETFALPVTVGDLDVGPLALMVMDRQDFTHAAWGVSVGAEVTSHLDFAYDPTAQLVAIAEAPQIVRANWWDQAVAETERKLEPDEETGEAPDAEEAAAVYAELSDIYGRLSDTEKELEAAQKALDGAPDDCTSHLELGQTYFRDGRYDEARPHLRAAGEMWSTWDAFSYDERQTFQEEKAKVEEKDEAWTGPEPQSNSCYIAWAYLAEAELALGNPDEAIKLYQEHGDLNPRLTIAAGNAWMAKGSVKQAEATFRQALLLRDNMGSRGGLAVVQLEQGKLEQAEGNLKHRIELNNEPSLSAQLWFAALAEAKGADVALAAAKDLAERSPQNPYLQMVYAELLVKQGQDAAQLLSASISRFEHELKLYDDSSNLWSGYASALMYAGRSADAKAAAEEALTHNARRTEAYLVLAQLADAEGDSATADKMRQEAVRSATDDPAAYWLATQR